MLTNQYVSTCLAIFPSQFLPFCPFFVTYISSTYRLSCGRCKMLYFKCANSFLVSIWMMIRMVIPSLGAYTSLAIRWGELWRHFSHLIWGEFEQVYVCIIMLHDISLKKFMLNKNLYINNSIVQNWKLTKLN